MSRTCFKVVDPTYRRNLQNFIGVSVAALDAWEVAYCLNEWANPWYSGSKLFVFASMAEAIRYRDHQAPSSHVYECEYKGELQPVDIIPDPCSTDQTLSRFWDGEHIDWKIRPPQGSMLVESVKPFLKIG